MSEPSQLVMALLNGDMDDASALLAAGETVTGPFFEHNKTRIFRNVVRHGTMEIVEALAENGQIEFDLGALDDFGWSFYEALATETTDAPASLAFLRAFLDRIEDRNAEVRGQTLLGFFLSASAAPVVVRHLIEAGCDVHYSDDADRTFIHHVVSRRMQRNELRLAYLHLLLDEGVAVDARDLVGDTALLMAIKDDQPIALIELLLHHDANPNEQGKEGVTAFYAAVTQTPGKETYSLLKRYASPDFDQKTKDGQHMLTSFFQGVHGMASQDQIAVLRELIQDGADLYQTSPYYGVSKSGVDWIAEKPAELLKVVLDADAINLDYQDDHGNTLLHKVCAVSVNFDADTAREIYRKTKLLLDAGADPSLTNDRDETPLLLAQRDNLKIKTVELLLKNQARPSEGGS
jgi:uncharacterized protein